VLSNARPAGKAGESLFLLVVGLALVFLVIGESTFLGLARTRFALTEPRQPAGRRSVEDSFPIRRLLPRR
jgi:hypothetical protein